MKLFFKSPISNFWKNLKPISFGIFIQFVAPAILMFLFVIVFYIAEAIHPGLTKSANDIFFKPFQFLGYEWVLFSAMYLLIGPLFGILTIYYYKGAKRTMVMWFPLIFYFLYLLPLFLGSYFPPLYNKPGASLVSSPAEVSLSENAKISDFSGSALVLQNNILWKIDNGNVNKLTDNSYNYDFSKRLLAADKNRYIISGDYSGSTVFDIEKQSKTKLSFNIINVNSERPLAIASSINGGSGGTQNVILNLEDLSQDKIKVSTSSAYYVANTGFLSNSRLLNIYNPLSSSGLQSQPSTVMEIDSKVLENQDVTKLLNQNNINWEEYTNDELLVNGSLTKNGVINSGIWVVSLDDKAPKLLYSPKDGSGIRAFGLSEDKNKLIAIKIKFNADQGSIVEIDLKSGEENPVSPQNLYTTGYKASSITFENIGWLGNKIWIVESYQDYSKSQYPGAPTKKYDIWTLNPDGSGVVLVAAGADNYLFLK